MKKIRLKKKFYFRNMILLFVCIISFIISYNIKLYSSNEEFIMNLLNDSNYYKKYEDKVENLSIFLAKNPYSEVEYVAIGVDVHAISCKTKEGLEELNKYFQMEAKGYVEGPYKCGKVGWGTRILNLAAQSAAARTHIA